MSLLRAVWKRYILYVNESASDVIGKRLLEAVPTFDLKLNSTNNG